MKIRTIALLVSSLWTAAVTAESPSMVLEGGTHALIFDVKTVVLEVNDRVKDGCMPRPNSVRASAEAALRRNKFSVVDKESAFFVPVAKVTVVGYAHNVYLCVVAFNFSISKFIGASVPHSNSLDDSLRTTLAPIELNVYSTILSGEKSGMQDRLEREAEKGANDLFITIERSKDYIQSKWPVLWEATYEMGGK